MTKYKATAIREFLYGFPDGTACKTTEAVEVTIEFPDDTKYVKGETLSYSQYGDWKLCNLMEDLDEV